MMAAMFLLIAGVTITGAFAIGVSFIALAASSLIAGVVARVLYDETRRWWRRLQSSA